MKIKGNINAGYGNSITGSTKSSILGGSGNTVASIYSVIGGGKNNISWSKYSSILGGKDITNYSYYGFIGGGKRNFTNSRYTTIVGGSYNYSYGVEEYGAFGFIGGGSGNTINYTANFLNFGPYSVIVGGVGNKINHRINTITGGKNNYIGGNLDDESSGVADYSFIGGGENNTITGRLASTTYNSVICGGKQNVISSTGSFIGSGFYNTIPLNNSIFSSIVGGSGNTIQSSGSFSFIGGGSGNTISHSNSHIVGSNITSVSANTTHVEKLNIKTLNGTSAVTLLALDSNDMVVDGDSILTNGSYIPFIFDLDPDLPSIKPVFGSNEADGNRSSILGGTGNTINVIGEFSSIIGGQNNIVNHTNSHIVGSNITSVSANTTHVESLNIKTPLTETTDNILGITTDGMVTSVTGITETLTFMTGATGDVRTLTIENGIIVGRTLVP